MLVHDAAGVAAAEFTAALLGRDPQVVYGDAAREMVRGQVVLVSGAGGSIGSELARQLHSLGPARLHLLDHDESALHSLQLDLLGHGLFDDEDVILCDVRDERAVADAVQACRPDIVFHAAAHKHLPLLERYPAEGIKTNVFGTLNLIRAARDAGVERFVNISTDKAARPTSVLGATKRLAELLVAAHAGGSMRVASVRFGNVLGSRGSFLHSLGAQLSRGQHVTVTDPGVTRFFMTIPEAAGLVIEAAVMARNGETYVLDMGTPVRIVDLVFKYLELTGSSCSGITFTGLRPGEKLHETLFDSAEIGRVTAHPKISSVMQRMDAAGAVMASVGELGAILGAADADELRSALMRMLPAEPIVTPVRGARGLAIAV